MHFFSLLLAIHKDFTRLHNIIQHQQIIKVHYRKYIVYSLTSSKLLNKLLWPNHNQPTNQPTISCISNETKAMLSMQCFIHICLTTLWQRQGPMRGPRPKGGYSSWTCWTTFCAIFLIGFFYAFILTHFCRWITQTWFALLCTWRTTTECTIRIISLL